MDNTKTLETERLILRKFNIKDAEEMFNNWETDPKTNKYLSWELHKDVAETNTSSILKIRSKKISRTKWYIN